MKSKLSEKLCFAWSGDYESLKHFVKDDLKLEGVWSQPGGDRKLFTFDDTSILWKKSRNILCLSGARTNEIVQKLCKLICLFDLPTPDARQSSMQSNVFNETLGDLQQGQLVNSEAIQALSETITHITSVMSQFQTFIDMHNVQNNTTLKDSFQTEYGNQDNFNDINKSLNNISFVFNECANPSTSTAPVINNAPELSDDANGSQLCNHEELTNIIENNCETLLNINNSVEHVEKETYAKVVASYSPVINTCKKSVSSEEKGKQHKNKNITSSEDRKLSKVPEDGFIGVERKRNKTKKFFLTGIAENVEESQIRSYLEKREITPTHIKIFPSRRKGTMSAKVHIPFIACLDVKCKPWQSKYYGKSLLERKLNVAQNGNYSTYV